MKVVRVLFKLLLAVVALYLLVAVSLYLLQDKLVFPGAGSAQGATPNRLAGTSLLRMRVPSISVDVSYSWTDAPNDVAPEGVLLWFLGNGEDLRSGVFQAQAWRAYGLAVLVAEYPGYGTSTGEPSATAFMASAEVFATEAAKRANELGVSLFVGGASMGAFSAVHIASRPGSPVRKMILSAPATTLHAAAKARFGWLPIDLLLRHEFDNIGKASAVKCATLILHGSRDSVIPQSHGRELASRIGPSAQFVDAKGYDHMLPLERTGAFGDEIAGFLGVR